MDTRTQFPVSDLSDAIRWLWTFSAVEEWLFAADAVEDLDLPLEARLVCDAFWITPRQLVTRLRKSWSEVLVAPAAPARERRHVWGR